jgi:hypothetical protein
MKKSIFIAVFITILSGTVLDSCKKPEVDTETQSATDNAICEAEFTAMVPNTNSRAVSTKGISGAKLAMPAGPFIKVDSFLAGSNWPHRLTIDFDKDPNQTPTGGFLDADGRTRKGRLSMLVDSAWSVAVNNRITIDSMNNYYVNGIKYMAHSIIITKTANSYSTTVDQGECVSANWWLHWAGTRTYTFVNPGQSNEEVHVTGSANGINKDGLSYTTNITSPIIKSTACTYISSGTIDITPKGKVTRTIDYSVDAAGKHNNACDNAVALTIKGNTFIFKID